MCIRDRHYTVPGDDFTRAGEASADLKARLKKLGIPADAVRADFIWAVVLTAAGAALLALYFI